MSSYNISQDYKSLFLSQLFSLGCIVLSIFAVFTIQRCFPNFFVFPYLKWTTNLENIVRFWPLFIYAFCLMVIVLLSNGRRINRDTALVWSIITSVMAGVWEELGYRWLFICFAMISLMISNAMFGLILAILALCALVFGLRISVEAGANGNICDLLALLIGAFAVYACFQVDPLFWMWRKMLIVINLVTFEQFESFFENQRIELFIFGMLTANIWFRDGHKYQGPIGMANAWIIGFVMMYAMLNYGLMTAIILHALYDIEVNLLYFIAAKTL